MNNVTLIDVGNHCFSGYYRNNDISEEKCNKLYKPFQAMLL